MPEIPRDEAFDGTLALLREGYGFIGRRCRRLDSDLFRTRLLLRPVICASGREATALLYDAERFTRRGAVPKRVQALLQDEGSVQSLDGAAHRHRKRLFLDMMSAAEIARLEALMQGHWAAAAERWRQGGPVTLHREARRILCAAACEWVGVPLERKSLAAATREIGAMIDGTGALGPRHWQARRLRNRSEAWLRRVVDEARAGRVEAPPGTPLRAILDHRDLEGRPLDRKVAAVELLNLLRPTVAIARFVAFTALALHDHPLACEALRDRLGGPDEDAELEAFVQEVRRFYPFFPMIGGIARCDFEWRGHRFAAGDWLLADLYGTNHDPRIWPEPDSFSPERFRGRAVGPDELVAQGAGDYATGHRCPGEWITIALMKRALALLLRLDYRLPPQDLSLDLRRFPALPASGVVIEAG